MSDGHEAVHAARRRLIANHSEEYVRLMEEERALRGLPARSDAELLQQQLAEAKRRIHDLEVEVYAQQRRKEQLEP